MNNFSPPQKQGTPFPIRTITAGIAALVVLLLVSTILTWRTGEQIRDLMKSQIQVLTAAERVGHYGSVLQLSIKAVVANGDESAAARYRAIQPRLRRTLAQLQSEIRLNENKVAAKSIAQADLDLVAMEYEALELARNGRAQEARQIIHSSKYDHLLNVFFEGVRGIERRAENHVRESDRNFDTYLWAITALSLASLGLVALGWFILIWPARRWGEQLDAARAEAEATTQILQESQAELEVLNWKLFDQARVDPLTKLHSRLRYNEDVQQLWPKALRYGEPYCAVMCDVDFFKQYNDSYGHIAGDTVLREVADAMSATCRGGDQIYRYGGEEFLLILRTPSAEEAVAAAERYRAAVEDLRVPHAGSASGLVTVSMGVALLDAARMGTAENWLKEADLALYKAKRSGRNRVVLASHVEPASETTSRRARG